MTYFQRSLSHRVASEPVIFIFSNPPSKKKGNEKEKAPWQVRTTLSIVTALICPILHASNYWEVWFYGLSKTQPSSIRMLSILEMPSICGFLLNPASPLIFSSAVGCLCHTKMPTICGKASILLVKSLEQAIKLRVILKMLYLYLHRQVFQLFFFLSFYTSEINCTLKLFNTVSCSPYKENWGKPLWCDQ